ncbi:YlqD family protein [Bacillus tianshenii]|nr:YlqD family protein [Bacillus tianshenii]
MQIIKSVSVKQILTEKTKKQLLHQFQKQCEEHRRVCEQLRFEEKKLLRQHRDKRAAVNEKFANEIKRREEKVKELSFQIEQLQTLPLGSELKERDVQTLVDVEVGADWQQLMNDEVIVIKDGIVHEIRQAGGQKND